jgi:hypothetical protein
LVVGAKAGLWSVVPCGGWVMIAGVDPWALGSTSTS